MGFTFPNNPGGHVAVTVPLVMFLWPLIVLYLFSRFPARKAVVISFLASWLFLPQAKLVLPAIPDWDKTAATCYSILLATFIFDAGRFRQFKFSWIDIPMLIWCLCPIASSLDNDLGLYDGISSALDQTMSWGVPYFLGRIYLNNLAGLRQLAMGIFVGGLIYIPLCLIEVRFSPQLHRIVYGDHGHSFVHAIRYGGFRPTVFMETGLAVGAFMMAATLIAIWFWQTGIQKKFLNVPMQWYALALLITFVVTKSTGAYAYLVIGLAFLLIGRYFKTAVPVYILIGGIAVYLYINAMTEKYFTDQFIEYLSDVFPPERIESLVFRFNNEEILTDKARQHLIFGWSGWGRSLVALDEYGNYTVQDSLWVIAFGVNGIVGLTSVFTAMLLPIASLFSLRYPARLWAHPKVAPLAVLGMIVVMYAIDCILNAMINPLYILACGGIAGLVLKPEKLRQAASAVQHAGYASRSRQKVAAP